ncbi:MAG: DNA polymerase III subunit delta [Prevotella sp.]|nr:DNA polymerase III subunit delta [Prevotella sp.]
MAEKTNLSTYESIMRSLKARQFVPVYLLMGDESYFVDRISDYVADNVLGEDERDFNQNVVFGADVTASQLADMCKGYPMMSEYRVVIVKEFQNMKNLEPLEKYLEKPVPTTILVLCYKNGRMDMRKRIVSLASAHGVVFESTKKRENELPGFISTYIQSHGATIENKAAFMIAEHVGADISRIISECDKLLISLTENDKRVTPELVEEKIGMSKEFNAFELRRAIVEHNVYKANLIVKYFNKNDKAGNIFSVIPLLFNFFQNLMIAHYSPNKNNEAALARDLDMRSGWGAREYITAMRYYTATKTMQIISKLRQIDEKGKGLGNSNTSKEQLLSELIFFILH